MTNAIMEKSELPFLNLSFQKMIRVLDQIHQNISLEILDDTEFGNRLFESYMKRNFPVYELYVEETEWFSFFTSEECVKVHALLSNMQDESFGYQIAEQALKEEKLYVESPFSDGEISICTESFYVFNRNFLRFRDENETFYIVQHHKSARAIYFPLRRCVIVIDKIALPVEAIYALNNEILRLLPYYQKNEIEPSFYGLIASYGRPYHFYYDLLPAIYKAHKLGIDLKKVPRIIQFEDEAFLSVRDFFDLRCEENFISPQALNEELATKKAFALKIGYGTKRDNNFDELDRELVDFARKTVFNAPDKFPTYHQHNETKYWFWFGVCSEKRAWKEQIEGLQVIIEKTLSVYPDAGFIFDGLTRTLSQSQVEVQTFAAQAEMEIFKAVTAELPSSVPIVNLIGASSIEKIAFSEKITLFVSSFLTDSMYPARIARKKGVGHGASVATAWDHLHPQTIFIPKKFVMDTNQDSNWSKVSYSIPIAVVQEAFNSLLYNNDDLDTYLHTFSFKSFSGIKCRIDQQKNEAIFDVNTKNEIEYVAIDDISLNFKDPGTRQFKVSQQYYYDFYCRAYDLKGSIECSLAIIGYSNEGRCVTEYIPLGRNKLIEFPSETKSFRMFLRLKGNGQMSVSSFLPVHYRKSISTDTYSKRDLAQWGKNNFEFKDVKSFLDSDTIEDGIYSISYPDAFLDVNFYRKKSDTLVIFFNAAIGRTTQTVLPAFSGMTAVQILNANILMISDPILYLSPNLSLGWFAGSNNIPLQEDLPKVLSKFIEFLDAKKVILYGGSGGGFAAMYYASFIDNAIAVVANPQTDIYAYDQGSVERYLEAAWEPNYLNKNHYSFDSNVAKRYFEGNYKLVYMQNLHDGHHLNKHLIPFLNKLNSDVISEKQFQSINERISLILGDQWGQGHAAPPKNFVYNLLNYIVNNEFDPQGLEDFLKENELDNQRLIDQAVLKYEGTSLQAELILNTRHPFAKDKFAIAWYLYKDGQKFVVTPYTGSSSHQFDIPMKKGIYWAVAFIRSKDYKESVKSKKIRIENE